MSNHSQGDILYLHILTVNITTSDTKQVCKVDAVLTLSSTILSSLSGPICDGGVS